MYDVIIIGAGPAGLTAALYAGRSKLKTKVLEKHSLGGQILLTEYIENFPGIYRMNSHAWAETLKKQLSELEDVQISEDVAVEKIEHCGDFFKIHIILHSEGGKDILESRAVIVATGSVPKKLGIKGEEKLTGKGVSYCATCDGPLFKNKDVVLVGGGNAAVEEALYLTRFVKSLALVHRRDVLRATAILQERIRADKKISFKLDSIALEVLGNTRVEGLKVRNVKSNQEEILSCSGIFVFIGAIPDTDFIKGFVELDETGCIKADENMLSSCSGVFVAGDCRRKPLNQAVTACSDGAVAAHSVYKFLEGKI